jgi:hypothetical protein
VRILFAVLFLAALAACSNTRQPPGPSRFTTGYRPPRDENYHGGPNALILKYDANHDGSVTRAELEAGLHADFDKYDTGHTGCLTADQVSAINATRIAADQSTATPLQDFRQDGCIDFQEFSAAPVSVFDELDRNGDGVVTPGELNARPNPNGPGARLRQGDTPQHGP